MLEDFTISWTDLTAQFSQIATIISVIFAAFSIRANTYLNKRQWNVSTFMTYAERHKEAINHIPDNAFFHRFDIDKLPPQSPDLTQAVLNYLFVISEVHYLSSQSYIDDSIWSAWREDLTQTLCSPLITREWPILKPEFQSFRPFVEFVEDIQRSHTLEKENTAQSSIQAT